jgi:ABC-2 type transport system ATP-binding protein
LLIFDEPFSGFDPVNTEILKKEILELKALGRTIIFSTHNMASVEEICDEIALINKAEVVLSGSVDEVRNRYKSNIFSVNVRDSRFVQLPEIYSVISETQGANHLLHVRIRKEKPVSNSELLTVLTKQHEIFSFTDELPSMKDVCLQVVAN